MLHETWLWELKSSRLTLQSHRIVAGCNSGEKNLKGQRRRLVGGDECSTDQTIIRVHASLQPKSLRLRREIGIVSALIQRILTKSAHDAAQRLVPDLVGPELPSPTLQCENTNEWSYSSYRWRPASVWSLLPAYPRVSCVIYLMSFLIFLSRCSTP